MAIYGCTKCGFTMERMVSTAYRKKIITRIDHCNKCEKSRRFYFLSPSGIVGKQPDRPVGKPGPNKATMWWRKQREGKIAQTPLDSVCKQWEY